MRQGIPADVGIRSARCVAGFNDVPTVSTRGRHPVGSPGRAVRAARNRSGYRMRQGPGAGAAPDPGPCPGESGTGRPVSRRGSRGPVVPGPDVRHWNGVMPFGVPRPVGASYPLRPVQR
ncbi:hypothetical protein GCM10022220_02600 [Actinocatenispora rupis]|uniref:Uncharacterized protein n=1 Tax=Actinocatenispora rupis TaxID=519421 RepID=A0A8J3J9U2_9ACTN|nr:hypothetical protein Aru02nite_52150 [Actinocatenispora rupis]